MSNTDLWDRLGKTNPVHTKPFQRSGGFKGTAIKPMWSYHKMTEEFGPCGEGWGINEPSFQVMPGADGEVLVYCTISIWYGPKPVRVVYGVGGDKVISKFSSGLKSDDEAFKKAFTDAITNALKLIGVGADVHMGLFEDSKYVASVTAEFNRDEVADDLMAWDSKLASASNMGTDALKATWETVPKPLKPSLLAALEKRHKPAAAKIAADA
jgi:hypothetical protein